MIIFAVKGLQLCNDSLILEVYIYIYHNVELFVKKHCYALLFLLALKQIILILYAQSLRERASYLRMINLQIISFDKIRFKGVEGVNLISVHDLRRETLRNN